IRAFEETTGRAGVEYRSLRRVNRDRPHSKSQPVVVVGPVSCAIDALIQGASRSQRARNKRKVLGVCNARDIHIATSIDGDPATDVSVSATQVSRVNETGTLAIEFCYKGIAEKVGRVCGLNRIHGG